MENIPLKIQTLGSAKSLLFAVGKAVTGYSCFQPDFIARTFARIIVHLTFISAKVLHLAYTLIRFVH